MKVYILGPMTGLPDENRPAFEAAARRLRRVDFEVVSPAELNPPRPVDVPEDVWWLKCMRRCIAALLDCEAVYRLDGWDWSRGGKLEAHIAREMRMAIVSDATSGGFRVEVPA